LTDRGKGRIGYEMEEGGKESGIGVGSSEWKVEK
jgi:hypothetical protein